MLCDRRIVGNPQQWAQRSSQSSCLGPCMTALAHTPRSARPISGKSARPPQAVRRSHLLTSSYPAPFALLPYAFSRGRASMIAKRCDAEFVRAILTTSSCAVTDPGGRPVR